MRVGGEYWFRPKRYGYGAEPGNWKVWLATGAYVLLAVAISLKLLVWPSGSGNELAWPDMLTWFAVFGVLTAIFVWLCWIKTDGEWRWRGGKSD